MNKELEKKCDLDKVYLSFFRWVKIVNLFSIVYYVKKKNNRRK